MIAPLPHLLGITWMDPEWLLRHFHTEFVWLSLAIVFVECGLLFPFLPGDTLLFAIGLFIAGDKLNLNLYLALVAFAVAAFLGNVVGYEIGRLVGPPLQQHEGRILKRKYFDQTAAFFDKHGSKALVIGRFVPFVRTYITVVAGVIRMDRRHFFVWSAVGAGLWVLVITLLGYFLGNTVPWLANNIDYATLAILAFSAIPLAWEAWRHRQRSGVNS
ncbi:DedA family protein [Nocardioides terrisoli]|uniref:DedA family protein n=1 Tax=Nocardioides terrisoli TaxID=3388267 RepID=UPI00287B67C6|nr:VTT domain-containing protein [Nocardioides marmorisolisilvae]